MDEPTREEIGDLLRRLVDTVVEMKDRAEALEAQLAERDKACVEWSEVSQRNYQRAKAAEAKLAKARAELARLEYWHDTDQELIDDMTPEQRDDHIYVWDWVKCILALLDHPAPAPTPEAVAGWQPIETAPSEHLIFHGNTRHDARTVFTGWKAQNGRYYADNGDSVKPTHWMPLPAPPSNPAPAPTPSPDDVAKFALGHAVGLCCPHEDDDDTARKARQECADAIAFASIVPDTIAEIIAKAGGKKDE
jgi:hypothetical protein